MFVVRNIENAAVPQNLPEAFVENAIFAIADVDQDVEAERARAEAAMLAQISAQSSLILQLQNQLVQSNVAIEQAKAHNKEQDRVYKETIDAKDELIKEKDTVIQQVQSQLNSIQAQLNSVSGELTAIKLAEAENKRKHDGLVEACNRLYY